MSANKEVVTVDSLTSARRSYLDKTFVVPILTDCKFQCLCEKHAEKNKGLFFADVRRISGTFISDINGPLLYDDRAIAAGWAYVVMSIWYSRGGNYSGIWESPGLLGEHYKRIRERGLLFSNEDKYRAMTTPAAKPANGGFVIGSTAVFGHFTKANDIEAQIPLGSRVKYPTKENHMEKSNVSISLSATITQPVGKPAFETRHFVYGQDITTMSVDQQINAIKRVEREIADLKSVKTKSARIAAEVKMLKAMKQQIVEHLDAQ